MPLILFPTDPLETTKVDREYASEFQAAANCGLNTGLVDLESLREGNVVRALRKVPSISNASSTLYRGWMLKPAIYEKFHAALAERSLRLIKAVKAALRNYLNAPAHDNETTHSIFVKPVVRQGMYYLAIMHLYQRCQDSAVRRLQA